ncbi:MAG: RNA polymerase sigma factor [Planctomycetia bacterium]|jgi:RNA polymerase sigma-70 factor (ECF subfamily)
MASKRAQTAGQAASSPDQAALHPSFLRDGLEARAGEEPLVDEDGDAGPEAAGDLDLEAFRDEGPELDEPAPDSGGRERQDADERAFDHALVRRAQRGDMDAFEALVRRHEARAWRVAKNLLPGDEDAQDIAQEAFLRVHKNLANFDFQHAFTTWLYRIVTNLSIDHLRRRRIVASGTIAESDEGEVQLADARAEAPSSDAERAETVHEVREVLKTLAPHFQTVLVLRELEGLSCLDIARIVGATHVTVRWRLHRGRQLFQDEWERRAKSRAARRAGGRAGTTSPNKDARRP